MNKVQIAALATEFCTSYDAVAKDRIWQQHRDNFRQFWSQRVLANGAAPLTDDECDAVIRILDTNGKGNTRASEAVARAMNPQGAWRRMFRGLQADNELAQAVDAVFHETEPGRKAALIDALYEKNALNKNRLTGVGGSVLNALLAAFDPVDNMTVISLDHRKQQLDFLQQTLPDWDKASFGNKIVQSNRLLRIGTRSIGVEGSARTQSCFWYFDPVRALWKPKHSVKTEEGDVSVSVPQDSLVESAEGIDADEIRKSLQVQAALSEIGARMDFKIWLPRSDRNSVLKLWKAESGVLLERLPLAFESTLLKTIEQIDVLWIRRRSIVRAFEVEHTTSIYSGLLRMADLLALQPNIDINLHIVAPIGRREKVLSEIRRPVFSLLEGQPLSKLCTFLSYESIEELHDQRHLEYLSDRVLEDYEERSEDED